jgi:hypothetical protein
MTQSDRSYTAVSVRFDADTLEHIDRLAAAGGLKRATIVQALVAELAPQVESVKPRTGVEIRMKGGRPPADTTVTKLKPGGGTPFDQLTGAAAS